eukprot:60379_1
MHLFHVMNPSEYYYLVDHHDVMEMDYIQYINHHNYYQFELQIQDYPLTFVVQVIDQCDIHNQVDLYYYENKRKKQQFNFKFVTHKNVNPMTTIFQQSISSHFSTVITKIRFIRFIILIIYFIHLTIMMKPITTFITSNFHIRFKAMTTNIEKHSNDWKNGKILLYIVDNGYILKILLFCNWIRISLVNSVLSGSYVLYIVVIKESIALELIFLCLIFRIAPSFCNVCNE